MMENDNNNNKKTPMTIITAKVMITRTLKMTHFYKQKQRQQRYNNIFKLEKHLTFYKGPVIIEANSISVVLVIGAFSDADDVVEAPVAAPAFSVTTTTALAVFVFEAFAPAWLFCTASFFVETVTAVCIPVAFIPIVTPAYVSATVESIPAIFTSFPTSTPVHIDGISGGGSCGDGAAAAAVTAATVAASA